MKHKIGEKTSSMEEYSRLIREALMVVEKLPKINPPSGRVLGQVRLVIPILESRRRNRGEYHGKKCASRVFGMGVNIGQRGSQERFPPSSRVPGQGLLEAPILKRRRRRNREDIAKKVSVLEGFRSRVKYRRRGTQGWTRESRRPLGAA